MRRLWPLCLSLLAVQAALAGPLQRSQVAAEATWLIHWDVDRMKQGKVGQFFLDEFEKPQVLNNLGAFQALVDFDLKKRLKSSTLYSRGVSPQDAVLLMRGDFEIDRLANVAEIGQDHRRGEYRSYTIHDWKESAHPARGGSPTRTYGVRHTNGTIILGQRFNRLTEALDVLDGQQPSLEGTNELQQKVASSEKAFLLVSARLGDIAQLVPPQAAMLKQVKGLIFATSETDGQLSCEMRLEAEDEEAAKNILTISQGLLALASMQAQGNQGQGNQAPFATLLKGLSSSHTNSTVTASFSFPAADLVRWMKDAAPGNRRPR